MAAMEMVFSAEEKSATIVRWRVAVGTMVPVGRVLFLYQNLAPGSGNGTLEPEKKFRATRFGRVTKFLVKPNDVIQPGQAVLVLEGCRHPTVMKDLCAECGADLREEEKTSENITVSRASVPMVHSVPELKVTPELAEKIGKEDEQRLLSDKKLVLLVDLDQTIVHTTNDDVAPNMKDVYHYQLYGPQSPWYHTRFRPHTQHFLSEMSRYYELHICTFGARNYAHTVAALLDKDGVLFSHRILSRDECFDPASKTANLKALFPCGDDMVCIIDDREDVWQGCGNLVQVKPYHYFRHTGDIHAPPGLEKNEADLAPSLSEGIDDENLENGQFKIDLESTEPKEEADVKKVEEETSEKLNEGKEENTKEPKGKETKGARQDEDHDDYLLYLEDILKRIHSEYYVDCEKSSEKRSLRDIIPRVRAKVLKELHITFSGLVPTHQKLEQSRAYKVARAFGAQVHQDLSGETTHLVAIRPGTAKVNSAKKKNKMKIVNPDWLWTCAERWEHVDERLYPLTTKARGSRIPPPHCSSPDRIEESQKPSDRFADSINPLMSFTQEEIDNMDKEVDEDMTDQDIGVSDVENDEDVAMSFAEIGKRHRSESSDSNDSNDGECYFGKKKVQKMDNNSSEDDDDETPAIKFRRGEGLPDDLDLGDMSQESFDLDAEDVEDDGEWNAMGAALEREFLSE